MSLVKKTVIFSFCAFILSGCSSTPTEPARIRDISDMPVQLGDNLATKGVEQRYEYQTPKVTEVKNTLQSQVVHDTHTSTVVQKDKIITTQSNTITYNRNYDNLPKGGYKGNKYTVKHGDTLYYIAWITGNDTRALAAKNNLVAPYELNVGQVLDVGGSTTVATKTVTTVNKAGTEKTESQVAQVVQSPVTTSQMKTAQTKAPTTQANNQLNWVWPAKGKVTKSVNGIDIAGNLGDKVVAAASGKVVYVGNDVSGYGNLIIIKHNDDFLTAYGHNLAFLVKEGQDVKAGQQIATMGSTGTNSVKSHVEVRYKTESVDPLKYFPKSQ